MIRPPYFSEARPRNPFVTTRSLKAERPRGPGDLQRPKASYSA